MFLNYTVKVDYENSNLLQKTILWTLLELNNDNNCFSSGNSFDYDYNSISMYLILIQRQKQKELLRN